MIYLKVNEIATKQGLTMSSLSRRTGLTLAMTRRYWKNEIRSVSLDILEQLAKFLKVNVCDLLKIEE